MEKIDINKHTNFQGKTEWRATTRIENGIFELFAMKNENGFLINVYLNDQQVAADKTIDTENEKEALLFAYQQACGYVNYLQNALNQARFTILGM